MASAEQPSQPSPGGDESSEKDWSTDLYDCHKDCATCVLALLCPCHVLGRNAKALGEGYWTWCLSDACGRVCLVDVSFALHMFIRQKIRTEKKIKGSTASDCATTYFCYPCALVQESQELSNGPSSENMARS